MKVGHLILIALLPVLLILLGWMYGYQVNTADLVMLFIGTVLSSIVFVLYVLLKKDGE